MTENPTTTDETPAELPAYKSALLEDLEEAMRDVVDPELGVNVVDLGLVYGIDSRRVELAILDMTLTRGLPLNRLLGTRHASTDRRPRPRPGRRHPDHWVGCRRGSLQITDDAASSCAARLPL